MCYVISISFSDGGCHDAYRYGPFTQSCSSSCPESSFALVFLVITYLVVRKAVRDELKKSAR